MRLEKAMQDKHQAMESALLERDRQLSVKQQHVQALLAEKDTLTDRFQAEKQGILSQKDALHVQHQKALDQARRNSSNVVPWFNMSFILQKKALENELAQVMKAMDLQKLRTQQQMAHLKEAIAAVDTSELLSI